MSSRIFYLIGIVIGLLVLLRFIQSSNEGFTGSGEGGADTFTMYYADWCPHCQSVKPAFNEWAKNGFVTAGGRSVKVSAVQPEKEPEKVVGKNIKGYPTFILETAEGKVVEFKGERNPAGYMKFLEEELAGISKPQE
jgi:thiol-disulfide isomerase/thioredoxin